jgi:hypothetical protein
LITAGFIVGAIMRQFGSLTLVAALVSIAALISPPESAASEAAGSAATSPFPMHENKTSHSWVDPPVTAEEAFAAQEQEGPAQAIVAVQPTQPTTPQMAADPQPVQPPAREAQSAPLHRVPTPAEAAAYIAHARTKIQQGDIAGARRLLERASERASEGDEGDAFFALAETYDPRMLAKWGVLGTKPDLDMAKALYSKAASRGAQGARERLLALGNFIPNK